MDSLESLFRSYTGVEPEKCVALSPSGSRRRYYRLSAGGESLVGVAGTDRDENAAFVALSSHFRSKGLHVPEVYSVSADGMCYLQQDLGDRLLYDDARHIPIATLAPDLLCITFSGLSKSHMVAGFRVGWMVITGNKASAADYLEGINMLSNMRLCSNVPAQSIVQTALGGYQSCQEHLKPGGRLYEQREFIYNALSDIPGVTVIKPKAAFYIFPKLDREKFHIKDDMAFAHDLLVEKGVLVVQGTGFNWPEPDHFRIVFLPHRRTLSQASERIADFLDHYMQK